MTWRGHTRGMGQSMQLTGIDPRVRAWLSVDLDKHIAFIRRSWARGVSAQKIADEIGTTPARIRKYAKRLNMVRTKLPSCRLRGDPTLDPIPSRPYRP